MTVANLVSIVVSWHAACMSGHKDWLGKCLRITIGWAGGLGRNDFPIRSPEKIHPCSELKYFGAAAHVL